MGPAATDTGNEGWDFPERASPQLGLETSTTQGTTPTQEQGVQSAKSPVGMNKARAARMPPAIRIGKKARKSNKNVTWDDLVGRSSLPIEDLALECDHNGNLASIDQPLALMPGEAPTPPGGAIESEDTTQCQREQQAGIGLPGCVVTEDGSNQSLASYELLYEQLFERIRQRLSTDAGMQTVQQKLDLELTEARGLLWKGNLLYVPEDVSLRNDILHWHHDVPWCGHMGLEKTLELVGRQFWWPRMHEDIKKYIDTCIKCQAGKPDRRVKRPGLMPLEAPSTCWQTLGVDLIVDLPPTVNGYDSICVFVCHLSKMVRLVPTVKTLTSSGFVELFFREVFPHYGMPLRIVSDRGSQWNSEFFRELCDRCDIRLHLSTAYHPQSNGLVERTNEVVETALRHFVAPDHRDWDKHVPFVEFALNANYKKTLECSSFAMNRITLPLTPFDAVVRNQAINESGVLGNNSLSASERTFIGAQQQFQWARKCVHKAKERMKDVHDGKALGKRHLYQTGDKVWLSVKFLALKHPSLRNKLVPRFIGPFTVLEANGPQTVKLDLPDHLRNHGTFNVRLVKPFMVRSGAPPPPVNIDGEEEWEVESVGGHNIVNSRRKDSVVEFQAIWKGAYEPSWHEFADFEHSIPTVEAYMLNRCSRAERRKICKALGPDYLLLSQPLRKEFEERAKASD